MLEQAPHYRALRRRCAALIVTASTIAVCLAVAPARPAVAAQAPARYSHDDSGFAVEAPRGWRLVRDGEFELPKGAKAAFIDARSDVIVYVLIEFIPGGIIARNDAAVGNYLARMMTPTATREVRRAPAPSAMSGRRALRGAITITPGANALINTMTVARDGFYYFALASLAAAADESRQDSIHQVFERAVTISKTSDEVVGSVGGSLAAFVPFLTADDMRDVMYALLDRATTRNGADAASLGFAISALGRERLPAADRQLTEGLQAKAFATLPKAESDFLDRIRDDIIAGREVARADNERCFRAFLRAYAALDRAEVAVIRRITLDSLRLGLETYDSISKGSPPQPSPPRRGYGVAGGVPGGVPGGEPGGVVGGVPGYPSTRDTSAPDPPRITRVSGGVLAGMATRRPQPPYPQMARAAGIEGAVVVEVTVSESGSVLTARAVSGHPLLRDAAVQAARGWAFTPMRISGVPVKVVGTITFNFAKGTSPPAS